MTNFSVISSDNAIQLPTGPTGYRPLTPDGGMLRFNTDTNKLEYYDGTNWDNIGLGSVTSVSTGTGLTGGPITTTGTISIATTGVSAGSYGSSTQVGTFNVNAEGQLTSANNVTITPAWSSITGTPTTLSGYGITSPLDVAEGGTSFSTYATGDVLYASATNTLSKLGIGTSGEVLTVSGGVPVWATLPASNTPGYLYTSTVTTPPTGSGTDTVVIGQGATAGTASDCIVIGLSAHTTNTSRNIVIGNSAACNSPLGGNTLIGYDSFSTGGNNAVAIGYMANANGTYCVAVGYGAGAGSSLTTGATAVGPQAGAVGNSTTAIGYGSFSNLSGAVVINGGSSTVENTFAYGPNGNSTGWNMNFTPGTAQWEIMTLYAKTTNATATTMFADGTTASNRVILPNNTCWNFKYMIVAHSSTTESNNMSFNGDGCIYRGANAASTTLVGVTAGNTYNSNSLTYSISITADTVNGALQIQVTGASSDTVNWLARIDTVEITA